MVSTTFQMYTDQHTEFSSAMGQRASLEPLKSFHMFQPISAATAGG